MSIQLPPPIALYVQLENAGDPETLSACFAPNATVRDEGRTYEGLAAIKAWKAETKRKYGTFQIPVDSSQETSGGGRMVFASRILKIHHHPAPTRGHTMKFLRRPD